MIGAIIEWYDFFAYGTAAALVFPEVFFPGLSPTMGLVVAYGTFSVGYLARPLGAILMGHVGDKIGRRGMLVLTVVTMGIATVLIGFLPGYATIGIWAPILLIALRLVQGFAVGGEVGGAILIAVEHAPAACAACSPPSRRSASPAGWCWRTWCSSVPTCRCRRRISLPMAGASRSSPASCWSSSALRPAAR